LASSGDFLGVAAVLANMPEGAEYLSAVDDANRRTVHPSIVANSIASAVEGQYGDHHRTHRTAGSRLWINPLMPIYWAFELKAIARRNMYIDRLQETNTMVDVAVTIAAFRGEQEHRQWEDIPV
jgi:hypothetical protein